MEELSLKQRELEVFWRNKSKAVYQTVKAMSSKDVWAAALMRAGVVEEALEDLCLTISDRTIADEAIIEKLDELIYIMAFLDTAACMRLIHWLENNRNKVLYDLVAKMRSQGYAEYEEQGGFTPLGLLVHRLNSFRRHNHLAEIFSRQRLDIISDTLNRIDEQFENARNEESTAEKVAVAKVV